MTPLLFTTTDAMVAVAVAAGTLIALVACTRVTEQQPPSGRSLR
jgi:hypothetical protein